MSVSSDPTLEDGKSVDSLSDHDFDIIWHDLVYETPKVGKFLRDGPPQRKVLKEICGRIHSRQLVAVMGPSGAGKSTLLECLIGQRVAGCSGKILFQSSINISKVKMAFIPQKDKFMDILTVRENIMFASKFQNAIKQHHGTLDPVTDLDGKCYDTASKAYHKTLVDDVIQRLGLSVCADNRVSQCSGGQMKRLSIAQELVSKPNILIMDEPTSGLDSATCLQVVQLLKDLTAGTEPISVIVTIHQPSVRVFELFHKVYMLSVDGKCIYDGLPTEISDTVLSYGLEMPKLYNSADFLIEVASGEHGRHVMHRMEKAQSKKFVDDDLDVLSQDVAQLPVAEIYKSGSKDHPFRSHVWYNFQREMVLSFRDPLIFVLRFVSSIIMAIFMSLIFGTVGRAGGCPPEIDGDFEPTDLDGAAQHIEHQLEQVFNNIGLTFFSVLFMIFNSLMPVAMTFPDQLKVFIKEKNNGWHKLRAFFFGKLLAELPFNIILPPLFSAVLWYMSEQVPETWRYLQYVGLMIVITFIGSSAGLAISAAYMNDMAAAIYLAPLSIIPIMTFSGMFVKLSSMPSYMRVITYASYLRWAFEGVMVTLYGYQRCGLAAETKLLAAKDALIVWLGAMLGTFDEEVTEMATLDNGTDYEKEGKPTITFVENIVDTLAGKFISDSGTVQSSVMVNLDLQDSDIYTAWIGLIALMILHRYAAYRIIHYQCNKNH